MTSALRTAAKRLLGAPPLNAAMRVLARLRGRRLVLVYHRLADGHDSALALIPTVPPDLFRRQIAVLREAVELVGLETLLSARHEAGVGSRPVVAITFDDDLPGHVTHALPVLQEFAAPAAFFLSGRALHGLGPYWFQQLEAFGEALGERRAAEALGHAELPLPSIAAMAEVDEALRQRIRSAAANVPAPPVLQADGIRTLAAAGMTIGFHTVDHTPLPALGGGALDDAVRRGVNELARCAGSDVRDFAYPHGKADARAAAAVRRAGFRSAFTGRPHGLGAGSDAFTLGRWEPGALEPTALLASLAVRLHRDAPASETARWR